MRILNNSDSRLHILLILAFSLSLWSLNYQALLVLNFFTLLELGLGQSKSCFKFAGFWAISKLLLDLLSYYFFVEHQTISYIFFGVVVLFLRLSAVFGLAFILCKYNSPRQLALSLSYFLRPILANKAWQIALTSSIMIHFLPKAQSIFTKLRIQIDLRLHSLPRHKKIAILVGTTISLLALDIDKQSLGLLSRSLDQPEAWVYRKSFIRQDFIQLLYPFLLLLCLWILSITNLTF